MHTFNRQLWGDPIWQIDNAGSNYRVQEIAFRHAEYTYLNTFTRTQKDLYAQA